MYPISRRRQCLPKQQHGRRALPQVMKMIVVMKVRGLCGSELLGVAADSCACIASDPFRALAFPVAPAAAFVQPPPPEDGEAPTLMDEMLSASVAAAKKKREEKAAARKKEDATFGAGLSAKAMFSAPVVVDDGDSGDDDDNSGAGGGVGAGGGASSAAGAGKRPSKQVKRVHKRPANPRMEAKLLAACAKGNMAGVRAALSLQLNLNCRAGNKSGQTPLALAAHGGHLDIVQELLAHDADPNATTKVRTSVATPCGCMTAPR